MTLTRFSIRIIRATDPEVLKAATSHDRILFTLDNDFLDLKRNPLDSHSGVVIFRPPRQGALAVAKFVKAFVRIQTWKNTIVGQLLLSGDVLAF